MSGGDGGAGGGLEGGGEGAVRCKEARVDGRDDGEEGDFGGWVVAAGAVGGGGGGGGVVVDAVRPVGGGVAVHSVRRGSIRIRSGYVVDERRGKPLPHGICIEGVQEFDAAARKQRRENRIDGPVDVVQRQYVQQAVLRAVLPRLEQAARLRRHGGLWDEHALGPVGCAGRVEHHAGVADVAGVFKGDGGEVGRGRGAEVLGELHVFGGRDEGQGEGFLSFGGEARGGEEEQRFAVAEDVL